MLHDASSRSIELSPHKSDSALMTFLRTSTAFEDWSRSNKTRYRLRGTAISSHRRVLESFTPSLPPTSHLLAPVQPIMDRALDEIVAERHVSGIRYSAYASDETSASKHQGSKTTSDRSSGSPKTHQLSKLSSRWRQKGMTATSIVQRGQPNVTSRSGTSLLSLSLLRASPSIGSRVTSKASEQFLRHQRRPNDSAALFTITIS